MFHNIYVIEAFISIEQVLRKFCPNWRDIRSTMFRKTSNYWERSCRLRILISPESANIN